MTLLQSMRWILGGYVTATQIRILIIISGTQKEMVSIDK